MALAVSDDPAPLVDDATAPPPQPAVVAPKRKLNFMDLSEDVQCMIVSFVSLIRILLLHF
jgi:hypothetical protein